jgi:lipopolysaccharide/colanic/teichoic acid biosynthesis glycosyltransferase
MNHTANQPHYEHVATCVIPGEQAQKDEPNLLREFVSGTVIPPVPWLHKVSNDPNRGINTPLNATTLRTKRLLDFVGAFTGLVLLWPVMLATALAVKISSPGEAIFSQQRVGLNRRKRNHPNRRQLSFRKQELRGRRAADRRQECTYGRPFTLYKFRTMVSDAEKDGPQFATQGDPRVTTLGRFMRKTRLDELPQLWNVLRGDMSLVGPRPERPQFIKELSDQVPNYLDRLQLKPGLTGVAQVVNGYDNNIDSFKRKVAYDLLYLRNCCLINDLKILFRTVFVVVTGKGAM